MIKTIAKEAGIVILLLIAIVLILGIVFYDYIPKNKTIPIKRQAYEFPEDIKSELKENLDETQNIVKTYYIDETDLSAYESKKDYLLFNYILLYRFYIVKRFIDYFIRKLYSQN